MQRLSGDLLCHRVAVFLDPRSLVRLRAVSVAWRSLLGDIVRRTLFVLEDAGTPLVLIGQRLRRMPTLRHAVLLPRGDPDGRAYAATYTALHGLVHGHPPLPTTLEIRLPDASRSPNDTQALCSLLCAHLKRHDARVRDLVFDAGRRRLSVTCFASLVCALARPRPPPARIRPRLDRLVLRMALDFGAVGAHVRLDATLACLLLWVGGPYGPRVLALDLIDGATVAQVLRAWRAAQGHTLSMVGAPMTDLRLGLCLCDGNATAMLLAVARELPSSLRRVRVEALVGSDLGHAMNGVSRLTGPPFPRPGRALERLEVCRAAGVPGHADDMAALGTALGARLPADAVVVDR